MNEQKNKRLKKSSLIVWGSVVLVAIGLAVMISLTVCKRRSQAAEKSAETETPIQKTVSVSVLRIIPRRVEDVMELPAILEPFSVADLGAERGGRIVDLPVDKGDMVSEGQLMLRLDSRMAEQALKQSQIVFREAEKEWTRWQELKRTGAVSESDSDAIRKSRDLAEVAVETARIDLSQCEVRAPMGAVVDARYVELGEYLAEGQRVFKILDVRRLKLSMDVPEMDIGAIQKGKEVHFRVPAAGNTDYSGKVTFIATMATPGSNAYRTEILVDNSDLLLKPGMIANVSLVRRVVEDAMVVPLSAVVPGKGEHVVFTVEDGHAVRHTVQIEAITGRDAVLRSGVAPGEAIVVSGQRTLRDGAPVSIEEKASVQ